MTIRTIALVAVVFLVGFFAAKKWPGLIPFKLPGMNGA